MTAKELMTGFKYAVWLANSINFEQFIELFGDMTDDPMVNEDYAQENWTAMRRNFTTWIVNLDSSAQEYFFQRALDKYQK